MNIGFLVVFAAACKLIPAKKIVQVLFTVEINHLEYSECMQRAREGERGRSRFACFIRKPNRNGAHELSISLRMLYLCITRIKTKTEIAEL